MRKYLNVKDLINEVVGSDAEVSKKLGVASESAARALRAGEAKLSVSMCKSLAAACERQHPEVVELFIRDYLPDVWDQLAMSGLLKA